MKANHSERRQEEVMPNVIKGYKGFDKDMRCRGFKYETGKEYDTDEAKACETGFHLCEYPLDVFSYYPPGNNRYAEAEGSGKTDKNGSDSKVSCTHIRIGSAATNTGDGSAATNTGDRSAATNTGYRSAATVEGKNSIAVASGIEGKASGALGCWIVLAEWTQNEDGTWNIATVESAKVDGEKIKAGVFYLLKGGEFVEAAP